MYVDKIMNGHNLMQAITRTNRVFKDKKNGVIVDYIGIGDNLKSATEKYTKGGGHGKPTIDIEQAFGLFFNQIETCKTFIPDNIAHSDWKRLRDADKVLLVKLAVNAVIKYDEDSNNFMLAEKKLSGLLFIEKSQPAIQDAAVDVLFIQHVSKAVSNVKLVKSSRSEQKEKIKEVISQSIDSDDIVDVFTMGGIEKPDISILDETFLLGAKKVKDAHILKIELINNILKDEIKLRLHKNIKKYTSLKEELEKVIEKYHNNALDSFATIAELVERVKELQNDDKRSEELGLSEEELAFYDNLAAKQDIIKEKGPIQDIVHAIVKAVKSNLQLDWTKNENAKASIRLAVKKELRGKISINKLNEILQEIMEQAEGQYSDWSA
ncbi:type I restriction enzyme endonuclease domain-containing protein [Oceanihabitans sediminis]|uniref:type I restriction enzyme endonuclease domain-containing protein n=1 Tax=Oceanihabitans sediminis TaxID=1812012 RepID=UPI00299D6D07|nr:type I restriction enzyme endonuclease domain-containing protein [Oceanihabitans sediminis]